MPTYGERAGNSRLPPSVTVPTAQWPNPPKFCVEHLTGGLTEGAGPGGGQAMRPIRRLMTAGACLLLVLVTVLAPSEVRVADASTTIAAVDTTPGVDPPASDASSSAPADNITGPDPADTGDESTDPDAPMAPGPADDDQLTGAESAETEPAEGESSPDTSDTDPTVVPGAGPTTSVTPLATGTGGVTIEAVDWRPGVVNTQTTEFYAFVDTGGVLVVGLGNTSAEPLEVTDVVVDGRSVTQLSADRQLMWWRTAPAVIPAGGVGAVTLKLLTPYGAGRTVDIEVQTSRGAVTLTTQLTDQPLRLANVTLDASGENLLVWVRNDGQAPASLPGQIAVSGQLLPATPSQASLDRGEVAFYELEAPPGGPRARYVSVGVTPVVGGVARPLYAHLKVAPAFNAAGGYGNAGDFAAEQAALGLNLVTRGMFSSPAQQQRFGDEFCTPFGIRVWLSGATEASDETLATQGADPCVAGFGRDEPEFRIYPANNDDGGRWDAMQAFADQSSRQSTATGDQLMDHITNAIGRSISSFAMLADVAGNDHYATDSVASDGDSSHPLEEAGYYSAMTRRAAEPRPSYDWAQWSADQSWATGEAWNRQPSVDEIRLQAYSMLQEGVKSLLWFTYNRNRTLTFPDLAREVARIIREQNLVANMVGQGAEAPGLATVTAPSGDGALVRAGALAGTDGVAVLVTNLDYTYTRVVRSKPLPPSPTPFAEFQPRTGVQVQVTVPDWLASSGTPRVVLVDPVTGPATIPATATGGALTVSLPEFTTTALLVVVGDEAAVGALQARWAQLTADIPGASAPDAAPGPVPPPNRQWDDSLADLEQDWEVATRDAVLGPPVVDGDTVFAVSRDGVVRSLALADGAQRWATQVPRKVFGGVAVSADGVYVATTTGVVVRLDRTTGAQLGRVQLPTEVMSTPVVAGGRLVVAGVDGVTRGLDPLTLAGLWEAFTVAGPIVADLTATTTGDTEVVVVGSTSGLVSAVQAGTGAIVWQRQLGNQVVAAAGAGGGRVVVGTTGGRLASLDAGSGSVVWSTDLPAPVLRQPGVANGQVVVGTPAYGGCLGPSAGPATFRAFDASSGTAQWDAGLLGCDFGHSSPSFGDGFWFAGTSWGSLVRIDPATGVPGASIVTQAWVLATPVVVGGKVVMGSDDQRIRLLDTGGIDPPPTTVAPPTSTTAPAVPATPAGSGPGGGLPRAGAQVLALVLAGVVLVAAGGAVTVVARRRRASGEPQPLSGPARL
jgi:outer membrane protein assembly factor BamB